MTRRGRVYTPKATHEFETHVAAEYGDGPRFEGPVSVSIIFNKTKTTVTISTIDVAKAKLTGDVDNYVKALLDGLNGIAWDDDRCVQLLKARKR
jgi:Holliday junction resolvase RusA-like endonuclease